MASTVDHRPRTSAMAQDALGLALGLSIVTTFVAPLAVVLAITAAFALWLGAALVVACGLGRASRQTPSETRGRAVIAYGDFRPEGPATEAPSKARDVESVLASRYWLTEKGWAATETDRARAALPDLERDGYAWPDLGGVL